MTELFPGLMWGTVHDNKDPEGNGRIKAYVPAVGDPYVSGWLMPGGWPGSGYQIQGSQYPIKLESTVGVFFEQGDPYGNGMYIPSASGSDETGNRGPTRQAEVQAAYDADASNHCATIWEDEYLRMFFEFHDEGAGPDERRFVLEDKARGSSFIFDVAAGINKKSVAISIVSATGITLNAGGNIDITGGSVHIQGRRVMPYGDGPI